MSHRSHFPLVLRYLDRLRRDAAPPSDDAELLRRFVRDRDEAAFELLVYRHGGLVRRVSQGVLRDRQLAEDVFQATFLALARHASPLARRGLLGGQVASWLYRVALNTARRALRQTARQREREASFPLRSTQATSPATTCAEQRELHQLLHEEIDQLAQRYRTPLLLCYFEGKTHEEAARELGWPKGTVAGRLSRARTILQRRLMRRGIVAPTVAWTLLSAGSAEAAVRSGLATATAHAAVGHLFGGSAAVAVSSSALTLSMGVSSTMTFSKTAGIWAIAAAIGLYAAGVNVAQMLDPSGSSTAAELPPQAVRVQPSPTPAGELLPEAGPGALAGKGGGSIGGAGSAASVDLAATPAVPMTPTRSTVTRQVNNFKQILLAMHNYHDVHGHFPNVIRDDQGNPILSWRVAILPWLEQEALYRQFHLDEPWDGPNNSKLLKVMPAIFLTPNRKNSGVTNIVGVAGVGMIFDRSTQVTLPTIVDGTSNTIAIIEQNEGVPWTKPDDCIVRAKKPMPVLGATAPDRIIAGFADGSVHQLKKNPDAELLHAAMTRNGGEVIDIAKLHVSSPENPDPPPAAEGAAPAPTPSVALFDRGDGRISQVVGVPPPVGRGGPPLAGGGAASGPLVDRVKALKEANAQLSVGIEEVKRETREALEQIAQIQQNVEAKQNAVELQKLKEDHERLRRQFEISRQELDETRRKLAELQRILGR